MIMKVVAIILVILLLGIFISTFVIYRRMPEPEGCENIFSGGEECESCSSKGCEIYQKRKKEEKR